MKKLILVRHGETEWNIEGRTQGKMNSSLTEDGLIQARLLGERLISEDIDSIYASHLDRAKSTAEIIGNIIGKSPSYDEDLAELGFGEWEGLTVKEIELNYPQQLKEWHSNPHKAIIPSGEGLGIGQERIVSFIKKISQENEDNNVLVISHGTIIKLFLLSFLNMQLSDFYRLKQDNCSINVIEFKKRGPVLVKYNDKCYMEIINKGDNNGKE
ncbi:histidine phosphatase family protein [Alkaliphilus peptidifermentans]|uniref:Probable phosphoglycerate mutase n=1 Tax=Alkaliphilus peptidifermentans DSM 18978 TaxID=1120976 RepID=A0A1G5KL38_9FIRM|nr:histidine phosphatase family protein [Alkaliphilus peptidifermentans]SCZ01363.1 probable phosphoglycerate mutase [Alkaliphilus peptidifermentans DSM 18978]